MPKIFLARAPSIPANLSKRSAPPSRGAGSGGRGGASQCPWKSNRLRPRPGVRASRPTRHFRRRDKRAGNPCQCKGYPAALARGYVRWSSRRLVDRPKRLRHLSRVFSSREKICNPPGSLPLGCTSTIEPARGGGPSASQASAPERHEMALLQLLQQRPHPRRARESGRRPRAFRHGRSGSFRSRKSRGRDRRPAAAVILRVLQPQDIRVRISNDPPR